MAVSVQRFHFGVCGFLAGKVSDEVVEIILGLISPPKLCLRVGMATQYEYCLGQSWLAFEMGLDAAANAHWSATTTGDRTVVQLLLNGVCSPTSFVAATLARALADFSRQCDPAAEGPQEVEVTDEEGKELAVYFRVNRDEALTCMT